MFKIVAKPILYGTVASALLLVVYFATLSLVSGWGFAKRSIHFLLVFYCQPRHRVRHSDQLILLSETAREKQRRGGRRQNCGCDGNNFHSRDDFLLRSLFGQYCADTRHRRSPFHCCAISSKNFLGRPSFQRIRHSVYRQQNYQIQKTFMKKTALIILPALVFLGGFLIFYQNRLVKKETPTAIKQTDRQTSAKHNWEPKTDVQALVTVTVTRSMFQLKQKNGNLTSLWTLIQLS